MDATYLNAIRDHGQSLITHVGLIDDTGAELTSGDYARQPCTWTDDGDGISRLGGDEAFATTAGDVVAGWRGYSALTGGINYGGADYTGTAIKTYANNGTYTLAAAQTTITHS